MKKLNRGEKIFLDAEGKVESAVNSYLACRDGIVECYTYNDESGYGSLTRLFLCENTKHESVSIIRQTFNSMSYRWIEETLDFDEYSFRFLRAIITGKQDESGGNYVLVRSY